MRTGDAEWQRKNTALHKKLGLCEWCSKPAEPKSVLCFDHTQKQRWSRRKNSRKTKGWKPWHPGGPGRPPKAPHEGYGDAKELK